MSPTPPAVPPTSQPDPQMAPVDPVADGAGANRADVADGLAERFDGLATTEALSLDADQTTEARSAGDGVVRPVVEATDETVERIATSATGSSGEPRRTAGEEVQQQQQPAYSGGDYAHDAAAWRAQQPQQPVSSLLPPAPTHWS